MRKFTTGVLAYTSHEFFCDTIFTNIDKNKRGFLNVTHDMTRGNPLKHIIAFSIPLLIGNLFQQLYSMADTVIVGRTVSLEALAAVGLAGSITFFVLGFVQGLTSGLCVVVSQRFGAEDEQGLRHAVAAAVKISAVSIVVITTLAVLGTGPLLRLMQTADDMYELAYTYLIIIFWGIIGVVFYNLISNIVRALGDSKTPLIFLVIACLLNIGLDFTFILVFKMGVAGAAVATIIAQILSGIACLIYALKKYGILRLKREDWKTPKSMIIRELKIGIPMGFQFSVTAIGVMAVQTVLNTLGSQTVAAYTAAARIGDIAAMPLNSIGIAMATYAAQNVGAGKIYRIKKGVDRALVISAMFSIVGGAVLFFFGKQLIGLFVGAGNLTVIEIGKTYLNVISPLLFILGVLFILRNTLQGMGYSLIPMLAGASELVMRGVIAVVASMSSSFFGVCLAEPTAWVGADLLLVPRYLKLLKDEKRKKKLLIAEGKYIEPLDEE